MDGSGDGAVLSSVSSFRSWRIESVRRDCWLANNILEYLQWCTRRGLWSLIWGEVFVKIGDPLQCAAGSLILTPL